MVASSEVRGEAVASTRESPKGMRNAGHWSVFAYSAVFLLATACSSSGPSEDAGFILDSGTCTTGCAPGLSCIQNSDFPGGGCTTACTTGKCPSGTVCSPLLSSGESFCLQKCATGGCPGSLVCTATSDGQVCLPSSEPVALPVSCSAPQLLVGPASGPSTDPGCRLPVVGSALPPGDVQQLGSHSPGERVSFNMPAGAAGFSIVSQAVSGQNAFIDCPGQGVLANVPVPSPISTPQGATFFDINANLPTDLTTASLLFFSVGGQQPYTAALTFPNTTGGLDMVFDGGLPGGQWSFDVNDFANVTQGPGGCDAGTLRNTYDVAVVVTPGPLPATGQMAVDVYLATKLFAAANAVNNPGVQAFAKRYASFYENAGVCVSTLTFHDLPPWAVTKFRSIDVDDDVDQDPCSNFRQMFTLAQSGRTMALFFVDDMVASGEPPGDSIVGKDGAIPGNATYNGTIAGGSAVLAADINSTGGCNAGFNPTSCGPDEVATIGAHETGHFLGLFHTTEQTGDSFDSLTDSAACVCALCETDPGQLAACSQNPDGGMPTLVDNAVCSGATQQCGGANLLMFWILTTSSTGAISPQEAAVMRANPLISAP
jgi:hypothetical protein